MKIKLHHILLISGIILTMVSTSVIAQDAGVQDLGISEGERDKMIYSPGEGDTKYKTTTPTNTTPKDSVSTRAQVANPVKTKIEPQQPLKSSEKSSGSKEDPDSILSFNFLYYIIQKYKLQDIVD